MDFSQQSSDPPREEQKCIIKQAPNHLERCKVTFANCLFPEAFSSVLPLFAKHWGWTSPCTVIALKLIYYHKGKNHKRLSDSGQRGVCARWVFVQGDF